MTQRAVLLQALASTPRDIERLLKGLPPEGRAWLPDSGGWSAQQMLAHWVNAEPVFRQRLRRIRQEDNPTLPHFDPEAIVPQAAPAAADTLLSAFAEARQATLAFLTELCPGEWQRPASASRNSRGATTLRWQVVDMMNHDLAHLGQLVDIRVKWDTRKSNEQRN